MRSSVWFLAAGALSVTASCGAAQEVRSQSVSTVQQVASEANEERTPEPTAPTDTASTVESLVDKLGFEYELAKGLDAPGERWIAENFFEATEAGPLVNKAGETFGRIPADMTPDKFAEGAPDLIGWYDPNGTSTIVGFQRKGDMLSESPKTLQEPIELYATDGTTVVGHIVTTYVEHPQDGDKPAWSEGVSSFQAVQL